jgi:plasmid stabilization system protein ParE
VNIVISQAALADIERLRGFLANVNPRAAQDAVAALSVAVQSLDIFPDRGRLSRVHGVRELIVPFGRSSYVLRYLHDEARQEVLILRVWHGREERD